MSSRLNTGPAHAGAPAARPGLAQRGQRALRSALGLGLAVLTVTLLCAAATEKPSVKLAKLVGTVEVSSADETGGKWQAATKGQVIGNGWKLRTGKKSKAQIVLPLDNVIILKENSVLTVDRLSADGGGKVKQEKGGALFDLKHALSAGSSFEVETPSALATVRGTSFGILLGGGQADASILKGAEDGGESGKTRDKMGAVQSNPLYQDKGVSGENPFYEGNKRQGGCIPCDLDGDGQSDFVVGDLDGDGVPDLIVGGASAREVSPGRLVAIGTARDRYGNFADADGDGKPDGAAEIGDLDGDGQADLVMLGGKELKRFGIGDTAPDAPLGKLGGGITKDEIVSAIIPRAKISQADAQAKLDKALGWLGQELKSGQPLTLEQLVEAGPFEEGFWDKDPYAEDGFWDQAPTVEEYLAGEPFVLDGTRSQDDERGRGGDSVDVQFGSGLGKTDVQDVEVGRYGSGPDFDRNPLVDEGNPDPAGIAIDESGQPRPHGGKGGSSVDSPPPAPGGPIPIPYPNTAQFFGYEGQVDVEHGGQQQALTGGMQIEQGPDGTLYPPNPCGPEAYEFLWDAMQDLGLSDFGMSRIAGFDQQVLALIAEGQALKKEEGGRHTPFHNKIVQLAQDEMDYLNSTPDLQVKALSEILGPLSEVLVRAGAIGSGNFGQVFKGKGASSLAGGSGSGAAAASYARGPRQSTSLDGSYDPDNGGAATKKGYDYYQAQSQLNSAGAGRISTKEPTKLEYPNLRLGDLDGDGVDEMLEATGDLDGDGVADYRVIYTPPASNPISSADGLPASGSAAKGGVWKAPAGVEGASGEGGSQPGTSDYSFGSSNSGGGSGGEGGGPKPNPTPMPLAAPTYGGGHRVAGGPRVAVGDVNGDGRADMSLGDLDGDGFDDLGINIGDLNGDGCPDLIVIIGSKKGYDYYQAGSARTSGDNTPIVKGSALGSNEKSAGTAEEQLKANPRHREAGGGGGGGGGGGEAGGIDIFNPIGPGGWLIGDGLDAPPGASGQPGAAERKSKTYQKMSDPDIAAAAAMMLSIGDLDGDGRMDFLMLSGGSSRVKWSRTNGVDRFRGASGGGAAKGQNVLAIQSGEAPAGKLGAANGGVEQPGSGDAATSQKSRPDLKDEFKNGDIPNQDDFADRGQFDRMQDVLNGLDIGDVDGDGAPDLLVLSFSEDIEFTAGQGKAGGNENWDFEGGGALKTKHDTAKNAIGNIRARTAGGSVDGGDNENWNFGEEYAGGGGKAQGALGQKAKAWMVNNFLLQPAGDLDGDGLEDYFVDGEDCDDNDPTDVQYNPKEVGLDKSRQLMGGATSMVGSGGQADEAKPGDAGGGTDPIESREILKTYFETGDVPTQEQFANLIDSCLAAGDLNGDGAMDYFLPSSRVGGGLNKDAKWVEKSADGSGGGGSGGSAGKSAGMGKGMYDWIKGRTGGSAGKSSGPGMGKGLMDWIQASATGADVGDLDGDGLDDLALNGEDFRDMIDSALNLEDDGLTSYGDRTQGIGKPKLRSSMAGQGILLEADTDGDGQYGPLGILLEADTDGDGQFETVLFSDTTGTFDPGKWQRKVTVRGWNPEKKEGIAGDGNPDPLNHIIPVPSPGGGSSPHNSGPVKIGDDGGPPPAGSSGDTPGVAAGSLSTVTMGGGSSGGVAVKCPGCMVVPIPDVDNDGLEDFVVLTAAGEDLRQSGGLVDKVKENDNRSSGGSAGNTGINEKLPDTNLHVGRPAEDPAADGGDESSAARKNGEIKAADYDYKAQARRNQEQDNQDIADKLGVLLGADTDGDGAPDWRDDDSDGDGVEDRSLGDVDGDGKLDVVVAIGDVTGDGKVDFGWLSGQHPPNPDAHIIGGPCPGPPPVPYPDPENPGGGGGGGTNTGGGGGGGGGSNIPIATGDEAGVGPRPRKKIKGPFGSRQAGGGGVVEEGGDLGGEAERKVHAVHRGEGVSDEELVRLITELLTDSDGDGVIDFLQSGGEGGNPAAHVVPVPYPVPGSGGGGGGGGGGGPIKPSSGDEAGTLKGLVRLGGSGQPSPEEGGTGGEGDHRDGGGGLNPVVVVAPGPAGDIPVPDPEGGGGSGGGGGGTIPLSGGDSPGTLSGTVSGKCPGCLTKPVGDIDGDGVEDLLILSSLQPLEGAALTADDRYLLGLREYDPNKEYQPGDSAAHTNPAFQENKAQGDMPGRDESHFRSAGGNFGDTPGLSGGDMLALGDLDGDGLDDFVMFSRPALLNFTAEFQDGRYVLRAGVPLKFDGATGDFVQDLRTLVLPHVLEACGLAVGDLNGDGIPDLLVSGQLAGGGGKCGLADSDSDGLVDCLDDDDDNDGLQDYLDPDDDGDSVPDTDERKSVQWEPHKAPGLDAPELERKGGSSVGAGQVTEILALPITNLPSSGTGAPSFSAGAGADEAPTGVALTDDPNRHLRDKVEAVLRDTNGDGLPDFVSGGDLDPEARADLDAHFKVTLDGDPLKEEAHFKEVHGLESEVEVIEYKDGDDPITHKRPGRGVSSAKPQNYDEFAQNIGAHVAHWEELLALLGPDEADAVLDNMRERINELEGKLKALGLLCARSSESGPQGTVLELLAEYARVAAIGDELAALMDGDPDFDLGKAAAPGEDEDCDGLIDECAAWLARAKEGNRASTMGDALSRASEKLAGAAARVQVKITQELVLTRTALSEADGSVSNALPAVQHNQTDLEFLLQRARELADEWDRYERNEQVAQMLLLYGEFCKLEDEALRKYLESGGVVVVLDGLIGSEMDSEYSPIEGLLSPEGLPTEELSLYGRDVLLLMDQNAGIYLPAVQDEVSNTAAAGQTFRQLGADWVELIEILARVMEEAGPYIEDNGALLDKIHGILPPGTPPALAIRNLNLDTDNDGIPDGTEILLGMDPSGGPDGGLELISPDDDDEVDVVQYNETDFEFRALDTDAVERYDLVLEGGGQRWVRKDVDEVETVNLLPLLSQGGAFAGLLVDGEGTVRWHVEAVLDPSAISNAPGMKGIITSASRTLNLKFGEPQGGVIIDLTPAGPSTIQPGGQLRVRGSISEISALGQWQIRIAYDDSLLQFTQGARLSIFSGSTVFFSVGGGVLTVSGSAPAGTSVGGEGDIFELTFTALEAGDTIVEGDSVELLDQLGNPIDADFGESVEVAVSGGGGGGGGGAAAVRKH